MNKPLILIVEDDKAVRNLIAATLEMRDYRYHMAKNGTQAITEAASHQQDLIILDLGLPDMDGVELIKKVRTWSNVPIIVVSARSEDSDKVNALDQGADDYLTKPFSVEELLARVRVSLRRSMYQGNPGEKDSPIFLNGDLKIDYGSCCVYIRDEEIHLTPIEYKLLCLLAKNVGRVLTHNFILNQVWGNVLQSDVPSLRVFMATLRKKIEENPSEPAYIQTHIGIGYRMLKRD